MGGIGAAGTTALIGAAGSVLGSGANAYATGRTNRKTRLWSERMWERQRDQELSNWALQNEYNSPQAQMQRLKEAGLNPNLIYGDGTVANSGKAPDSPSAPHWSPEAPQIDLASVGGHLGAYYDYRVKEAQTDNLKAQQTVAAQDALLKAAQTNQTIAHTEGTKFDTDLKMTLRENSVDLAKQTLAKLQADTGYTLDQNTRAATQLEDHLKTTKVGRQKTQSEINEIKQKLINLKTENKIKEFEVYLNSLGLTPHDDAKIRKLVMAMNPPKGRVSARTGGRTYHPNDGQSNDKRTRYGPHD